MQGSSVLLASHNTQGAQAAEELALSVCADAAKIDHLVVVPDFWDGMMGDDWLNNAATRKEYGDYIEHQLEDEIRQHAARLRSRCDVKGLSYRLLVAKGKTENAILDQASQYPYELVIIGSQRPKGIKGLNSKVKMDVLSKKLALPLLVAPYPV